jgi:hypothetical protein
MFLERAQAGRRLPRVEDHRARARHAFDVAAGQRRDPRQPLHEVQRDALGNQDRTRRSRNVRRDGSGAHARAVFCVPDPDQVRVDRGENGARDAEPGERTVGLDEQHGIGARAFVDAGERRDVAAADVLGERLRDERPGDPFEVQRSFLLRRGGTRLLPRGFARRTGSSPGTTSGPSFTVRGA